MKKAEYKALYMKMKKEDHHVQVCLVCRQKGMKSQMHPHHLQGRHGENMLNYKWVHPDCHRTIHDNPKLATEHGWLIEKRNT